MQNQLLSLGGNGECGLRMCTGLFASQVRRAASNVSADVRFPVLLNLFTVDVVNRETPPSMEFIQFSEFSERDLKSQSSFATYLL